MLRRFDLLVRDAREQSGNQRYSSTQGVPQREFSRYGNDAQQRIYNKILMERPSLFCKAGFLDSVRAQASYTLPTDVYLKHNITKVDYSYDGAAVNYSPLEFRTAKQELSVTGYPSGYFLRDGSMVVSPIPSNSATNAFRLNYQYTIPTLDIRRGTVASYSTGGLTVNTLTVTDNALFTQETKDDLTAGNIDYMSIVNKDGTISASAIPVVSYASNVITCTHTLAAGETIAVGAYIVFGSYATTHSVLPPVCERYITEYMSLRTQMRDSNAGDAAMNSPLLEAIEKEIIDSIANLEEDTPALPISDYSMLNYTDSWE